MKNALIRRIVAAVTAVAMLCCLLCGCDMEQLEALGELFESVSWSDISGADIDIDMDDIIEIIEGEVSDDELSASDTVGVHPFLFAGEVYPFFNRFLVRARTIDVGDVGLFRKRRRASLAFACIDDKQQPA